MSLTIKPLRELHGEYRVSADPGLACLAATLAAYCPETATINNWPADKESAAFLSWLRGRVVPVEETDGNVQIRKSSTNAPASEFVKCPELGPHVLGLVAGACSCLVPHCDITHLCTGLNVAELDRLFSPVGMRAEELDGKTILHSTDAPPTNVTIDSLVPWLKDTLLLRALFARTPSEITLLRPTSELLERVLAVYHVPLETTRPPRPVSRREQLLQGIEQVDEPDAFHKRLSLGAGPHTLRAVDWVLPGDFSQAVLLIAAAAVRPGSQITTYDVALDSSRTGILKVLKRMGSELTTTKRRTENGIPVGEITVSGGTLKATKVGSAEIPALVPHLPLLAVIAGSAIGVTVIRGFRELIDLGLIPHTIITANLRALGVKVAELPDGWAIEGPTEWQATTLDAAHRPQLAAAWEVAAFNGDGPSTITNADSRQSNSVGFLHALTCMSERQPTNSRSAD